MSESKNKNRRKVSSHTDDLKKNSHLNESEWEPDGGLVEPVRSFTDDEVSALLKSIALSD